MVFDKMKFLSKVLEFCLYFDKKLKPKMLLKKKNTLDFKNRN